MPDEGIGGTRGGCPRACCRDGRTFLTRPPFVASALNAVAVFLYGFLLCSDLDSRVLIDGSLSMSFQVGIVDNVYGWYSEFIDRPGMPDGGHFPGSLFLFRGQTAMLRMMVGYCFRYEVYHVGGCTFKETWLVTCFWF